MTLLLSVFRMNFTNQAHSLPILIETYDAIRKRRNQPSVSRSDAAATLATRATAASFSAIRDAAPARFLGIDLLASFFSSPTPSPRKRPRLQEPASLSQPSRMDQNVSTPKRPI